MSAPHTLDLPSTAPISSPPRSLRAGLARAAWQLHRTLVLTGLVATVALIGLLALFRAWVGLTIDDAIAGGACAGRTVTTDCLAATNSEVYATVSFPYAMVQLACLGLAAGGGLIIGASTFAREFEQRTQVFALTQSVGRASWWAAKVLVTVLPMVGAMLALSAAAGWAFDVVPYRDVPMSIQQFYFPAGGPAAIYLLCVSVALTAGILTRSTVGALIAAAVICVLVGAGGEAARPGLAPVDRVISEPDGYPLGDWWIVDSGYLGADGREVGDYYYCPLWTTTTEFTTTAEFDQIEQQCQAEAGIVSSFTDVIPATRYWQVRAWWSGGLVALSGIALLLGLLRIRRRVL